MPSTDAPSVLIVRLDAIGDALTTVPLVAALRAAGARVGMVVTAANREALAPGALDARTVAPFALRDGSAGNRDAMASFAAEIAAQGWTHALIPTEDWGGYRLAREAGIPARIGFENGWGKPFKTLRVRAMCTGTVRRTAGLDRRGRHECEVVFALGASLLRPGATPSRDPAVLRPFVVDGPAIADPRVVIQITEKWRRLGAELEDVVALVRALGRRFPLRAVAAADEAAFAGVVAARAGIAVERFAQLAPWKAAIASARALVAPDGGAIHVAGMTGTPTVAVFPAIRRFAAQTARWAPWAAPHRIVALVPGWPDATVDALRGLSTAAREP